MIQHVDKFKPQAILSEIMETKRFDDVMSEWPEREKAKSKGMEKRPKPKSIR